MKPLIALLVVLTWAAASAQSLISSPQSGELVRLQPFDAAVLDMQVPRDDLACSVTALRPELQFDFLFRAGYEVRIPLRELAGTGNRLTIVLRVRSERHKDQPVYFYQKFSVPEIEQDRGGTTVLEGAFRLGDGKYHVDWLMRDTDDRVCAKFWDVEANLSRNDIPMTEGLARDLIQPAESTPFYEDGAVERQPAGRSFNIKVIVNFAPQELEAVSLGSGDLQGLVAILRKIGREPRIGSFSVVACSVRSQQILYRQRNAPNIDLPALGEALKSLNLGSVDAKLLALKNGETEFLGRLISDEVRDDHPDGLIFVSPKFLLKPDVSQEVVEQLRDLDYPIFYLNYNLFPVANPWRDSIGRVIKQLKGIEYGISRPRDLFNAWSDIVSRMLSTRPAGRGGTELH